MTDEEYKATQELLITFAGQLELLDLKSFIDRIQAADSLGAVLDPTAYRAGQERLAAIRGLAVAAREVQKAHAKLVDVVGRTEREAERFRTLRDQVHRL
jgi:hypothetical protein